MKKYNKNSMATFKTKERPKHVRQRKQHDSDDEGVSTISSVLDETREEQKFRKRSAGVSTISLAIGEKIGKEQELLSDPRLIAVIEATRVKDRDRDRDGEGDIRGAAELNSAFSTGEKVLINQDAAMLAYIEDQMKERRLSIEGEEVKVVEKSEYERMHESLYAIPDKIKEIKEQAVLRAKPKTGMLSASVLTGIPEVDLGIETKLKNIERTEASRLELISKRKSKEDNKSSLTQLPSFQKDRFAGSTFKKPENTLHRTAPGGGDHAREFDRAKKIAFEKGLTSSAQYQAIPNLHGHHRPGMRDQASDDHAFDSFKKKMRRF